MRTRLQRQVWRRARDACEYCRVPQAAYRTPFHVDHVISRQHGGTTVSENLALACFHCNAHKGPNVAGIDPVTGSVVRLFHPRNDRWDDHFTLHGAQIVGTTDVGRATVAVLDMNEPLALAVRQTLLHEGIFPAK